MEHRQALMILNMLPGIGPGKKRFLEVSFGSVEAAMSAPFADVCRVPGIGERHAKVICRWWEHCNPDDELRLIQQSGVSLVTEEDEAYPPLLRQIHDPPICLYVRGNPQALRMTERSVAIVGSRNCTGYGSRMAGKFAFDAASCGWPVISGLARGVDTAAHDGALRGGGCTVAVIGCGLAGIYPRENLPLALRMADNGGAVVSEFPMRYQADKRSFPMRNRIISGIATGTVVVEAGMRSGSLITAAQALDQGRTVFAVPGPADSYASQGCNALIRDGAVLVTCFQDVVEEFTGLPGLKRTGEAPPGEPVSPVERKDVQLQGLELKLWKLIEAGEEGIDELVDASGEEPSCVMAALLTLELKRLIRQLPGRRIQVLARCASSAGA